MKKIILLMCLIIISVWADYKEGMNICSEIDINETRLSCYDNIVKINKKNESTNKKQNNSEDETLVDNGEILYWKCTGCHGDNGETKALGKSEIIAGQTALEIETKIIEYKAGTRNSTGMGMLMKGQVSTMSNNDIKSISAYMASFKKKKKETPNEATKEKEIHPETTKVEQKSANWDIYNNATLMGDSHDVVISTTGKEIGYSGDSTSLVIRCKNNKTDIYLNFGYLFMGTDGQTGRIKFDNNKPYKKWLGGSVDGTALFFTSRNISFIKKIMKHKKMIVEIRPYSKVSKQVEFNIDGLSKIISPLRKECHW